MKKLSIKELVTQYLVTLVGISLVYFPYIFIFWTLPGWGDLDYISSLQYGIFIVFFLSLCVFLVQDVIFRAIGEVKIKNVELFILVALFTGIFLVSDFSFMGDFLMIVSNFLLSPIIFGIYLIYLKYQKN